MYLNYVLYRPGKTTSKSTVQGECLGRNFCFKNDSCIQGVLVRVLQKKENNKTYVYIEEKDFKELTHVTVEDVRFEIYRAGPQTGDPGKTYCCNSSPKET